MTNPLSSADLALKAAEEFFDLADGIAVFDALHRRGTVSWAILLAFDLLELNGEDHRPLPLGRRKNRLVRLPANVPPEIELTEHTPIDGAAVIRHACAMGRRASYRSGSPHPTGPGRHGTG